MPNGDDVMSTVKTNEVATDLREQGILSESVINSLERETRNVEVADISPSYTDRVFSCFLIDESGSMGPYKQSVIDGQHEMLEILRKSDKCKKDALYVVQYLFSDTAKALNPFSKLSPDGNDDVIILKSGDYYKPNSSTALYKSIFYLLQDMVANIASVTDMGMTSTFTIGVITDGDDTDGGIEPEEIRNIIQELLNKEILRSAVIIGLTNPYFTKAKLEELKTTLGFQRAIDLSQDDERAIRRAFVLASQSAVTGQN